MREGCCAANQGFRKTNFRAASRDSITVARSETDAEVMCLNMYLRRTGRPARCSSPGIGVQSAPHHFGHMQRLHAGLLPHLGPTGEAVGQHDIAFGP